LLVACGGEDGVDFRQFYADKGQVLRRPDITASQAEAMRAVAGTDQAMWRDRKIHAKVRQVLHAWRAPDTELRRIAIGHSNQRCPLASMTI
jgi:hypothetical protein